MIQQKFRLLIVGVAILQTALIGLGLVLALIMGQGSSLPSLVVFLGALQEESAK